MKRLITALNLLVFVLTVTGLAPAQNDPRIGTWKLNVAKSKFIPGAARRSETRTYKSAGDSTTLDDETVLADGTKLVFGYTGKADGKDYPYTGQQPGGAETLSVKRSGNTFLTESKKDGKLLFTTEYTFSNDGKVMTLTNKGTRANGLIVNSVLVYDKQ